MRVTAPLPEAGFSGHGTSLLKAGPSWDPRSWPARPLVRYDDLEDGVSGLSASAEAAHFRFCSPARFFALSVSAHQNVNSVAGGALSAPLVRAFAFGYQELTQADHSSWAPCGPASGFANSFPGTRSCLSIQVQAGPAETRRTATAAAEADATGPEDVTCSPSGPRQQARLPDWTGRTAP